MSITYLSPESRNEPATVVVFRDETVGSRPRTDEKGHLVIATTRIAALALALVAAVAPATAHADAPERPDIEYRVVAAPDGVLTTLSRGGFTVDRDAATVTVVDEDGTPVMTLPTRFVVGDRALRTEVAVDGAARELRMRPKGWEPLPEPAARPVASPLEDRAALADFSTRFGLATAVGTFVGTAAGLVVGTVAGCMLAGLGCLPGAVTGASLGGVIGTIVVGGPVLVISAVELIDTLTAPSGSSRWARVVARGSAR